ncbi:hypothetical protein HAX54_011150 [Datura stramonium]|uniref:DNA-directed RNA polymerase n=1 Tax=Datura stramonium TaxID=4076 RepID=A0ABS8TJ95_DATST|nr:hypothetical protein [Datura stramonium]
MWRNIVKQFSSRTPQKLLVNSKNRTYSFLGFGQDSAFKDKTNIRSFIPVSCSNSGFPEMGFQNMGEFLPGDEFLSRPLLYAMKSQVSNNVVCRKSYASVAEAVAGSSTDAEEDVSVVGLVNLEFLGCCFANLSYLILALPFKKWWGEMFEKHRDFHLMIPAADHALPHAPVNQIVRSQDDSKPWGQAAKAKVGSRLIELLLQTAYIQSPADQLAVDPPDIRPAFIHSVRTDLKRTARHMVIPYMPMLVPPVKWTGYDKGGHLYLPSYVMRTHGARQQREAVEPPEPALDTLGSTKWRINKRVLSIVDRIWASGGRLADLVDRDDVPLPEEPDTEDEALHTKWRWKPKSVRKRTEKALTTVAHKKMKKKVFSWRVEGLAVVEDSPLQICCGCEAVELIPSDYSHIPVHQGPVLRGLQHYAALGRDKLRLLQSIWLLEKNLLMFTLA